MVSNGNHGGYRKPYTYHSNGSFYSFDFKASSWQGYVPPTVDTFKVSDFTGAGTYSMDFPNTPGQAVLSLAELTYNSQVIDEGSAYSQASFVGMDGR